MTLRDKPLRSDQIPVVELAVKAFKEGADVVVLELPTGVGKSKVGPEIARELGLQAIHTTKLKLLQKQMKRDYDEDVKLIMGRINYIPIYASNGQTCKDCSFGGTKIENTLSVNIVEDENDKKVVIEQTGGFQSTQNDGRICDLCPSPYGENCPYLRAKSEARAADLACSNFSYFLQCFSIDPTRLETDVVDRWRRLAGTEFFMEEIEESPVESFREPWQMLIIDEADDLEDELLELDKYRITGDLFPKGIDEPGAFKVALKIIEGMATEAKNTHEEDVSLLRKVMDAKLSGLEETVRSGIAKDRGLAFKDEIYFISKLKEETDNINVGFSNELAKHISKYNNQIKHLEESWKKINEIKIGFEQSPRTWVNQGEYLMPVMVNEETANTHLWSRGQKILVMSGTVLDHLALLKDIGCPEGKRIKSQFIRLGSPFPENNRIINHIDLGKINKDNRESMLPLIVEAIEIVLRDFSLSDERTVVLCPSYGFWQYHLSRLLNQNDVRRPIFTHTSDPENKDLILEEFRQTPGAILLGVKMERGMDFNGDDCRNLIIPKVMWPDLSDPRISARKNHPGGEYWYQLRTARTMIQATGRAVRGPDDWARIFILDGQLVRLLDKLHKRHEVLPQWWWDSIRWNDI